MGRAKTSVANIPVTRFFQIKGMDDIDVPLYNSLMTDKDTSFKNLTNRLKSSDRPLYNNFEQIRMIKEESKVDYNFKASPEVTRLTYMYLASNPELFHKLSFMNDHHIDISPELLDKTYELARLRSDLCTIKSEVKSLPTIKSDDDIELLDKIISDLVDKDKERLPNLSLISFYALPRANMEEKNFVYKRNEKAAITYIYSLALLNFAKDYKTEAPELEEMMNESIERDLKKALISAYYEVSDG